MSIGNTYRKIHIKNFELKLIRTSLQENIYYKPFNPFTATYIVVIAVHERYEYILYYK